MLRLMRESLIFSLDGGNGSWNWHVDGYSNSTDDLEIPGFAESEVLRHAEEEEGEEHDEEETAGLLENSAVETRGGSLGTTFVGDWGHFGFAVSQIGKDYGVPGHAHHEDAEHEETEEEHDEESVLIEMEQTRYDLQAEFDAPLQGFEQLFVGYAYTDYEHVEIEGEEIGTRFSNEAWELKSYLKHDSWNGWVGVWGCSVQRKRFFCGWRRSLCSAIDNQVTSVIPG